MYAAAPADEPFVLVRIINETDAEISTTVVVDDGTAQPLTFPFTGITPEQKEEGVLVRLPVLQLALGSLTDPLADAVIATHPAGLTVGAPFGRAALQNRVDFNNGDTVIFVITQNPTSSPYVTVSVGRIDGSTQPAPSRRDTFGTVRALLQLNGLLGPVLPTVPTVPVPPGT